MYIIFLRYSTWIETYEASFSLFDVPCIDIYIFPVIFCFHYRRIFLWCEKKMSTSNKPKKIQFSLASVHFNGLFDVVIFCHVTVVDEGPWSYLSIWPIALLYLKVWRFPAMKSLNVTKTLRCLYVLCIRFCSHFSVNNLSLNLLSNFLLFAMNLTVTSHESICFSNSFPSAKVGWYY